MNSFWHSHLRASSVDEAATFWKSCVAASRLHHAAQDTTVKTVHATVWVQVGQQLQTKHARTTRGTAAIYLHVLSLQVLPGGQ